MPTYNLSPNFYHYLRATGTNPMVAKRLCQNVNNLLLQHKELDANDPNAVKTLQSIVKKKSSFMEHAPHKTGGHVSAQESGSTMYQKVQAFQKYRSFMARDSPNIHLKMYSTKLSKLSRVEQQYKISTQIQSGVILQLRNRLIHALNRHFIAYIQPRIRQFLVRRNLSESNGSLKEFHATHLQPWLQCAIRVHTPMPMTNIRDMTMPTLVMDEVDIASIINDLQSADAYTKTFTVYKYKTRRADQPTRDKQQPVRTFRTSDGMQTGVIWNVGSDGKEVGDEQRRNVVQLFPDCITMVMYFIQLYCVPPSKRGCPQKRVFFNTDGGGEWKTVINDTREYLKRLGFGKQIVQLGLSASAAQAYSYLSRVMYMAFMLQMTYWRPSSGSTARELSIDPDITGLSNSAHFVNIAFKKEEQKNGYTALTELRDHVEAVRTLRLCYHTSNDASFKSFTNQMDNKWLNSLTKADDDLYHHIVQEYVHPTLHEENALNVVKTKDKTYRRIGQKSEDANRDSDLYSPSFLQNLAAKIRNGTIKTDRTLWTHEYQERRLYYPTTIFNDAYQCSWFDENNNEVK